METLLSSAFLAAVVSALVAVLTSERRIAAENVLQERKKWRDQIREVASEVRKTLALGDVGKLGEMQARFSLLVNPHCRQDQDILQLIMAGDVSRAAEFTQRVVLLLKHDWERAKHEASFRRWLLEQRPVRVRFEEFEPGREHDYHAWRGPIRFFRRMLGLT